MTLGRYLTTWRYLATWHWQCHVSHQGFGTWQFFSLNSKKIKILKKLKISEDDTWHTVNGVNNFFSKKDLIDTLFQKFGRNWNSFKSGYQTETSERKWVLFYWLNLLLIRTIIIIIIIIIIIMVTYTFYFYLLCMNMFQLLDPFYLFCCLFIFTFE